MNVMKKESEGKYSVTLESGETYTGVPCLGAYENEREALSEIFGGQANGQAIKGLFSDKATETGVLFYYEGDKDLTRYIFIKESIFEPVFLK